MTRRETQEYVDVRETQIAVEQHDAPPHGGKRRRKVHRHARLADAAFPARHRNHLDRARLRRALQSGCLHCFNHENHRLRIVDLRLRPSGVRFEYGLGCTTIVKSSRSMCGAR